MSYEKSRKLIAPEKNYEENDGSLELIRIRKEKDREAERYFRFRGFAKLKACDYGQKSYKNLSRWNKILNKYIKGNPSCVDLFNFNEKGIGNMTAIHSIIQASFKIDKCKRLLKAMKEYKRQCKNNSDCNRKFLDTNGQIEHSCKERGFNCEIMYRIAKNYILDLKSRLSGLPRKEFKEIPFYSGRDDDLAVALFNVFNEIGVCGLDSQDEQVTERTKHALDDFHALQGNDKEMRMAEIMAPFVALEKIYGNREFFKSINLRDFATYAEQDQEGVILHDPNTLCQFSYANISSKSKLKSVTPEIDPQKCHIPKQVKSIVFSMPDSVVETALRSASSGKEEDWREDYSKTLPLKIKTESGEFELACLICLDGDTGKNMSALSIDEKCLEKSTKKNKFVHMAEKGKMICVNADHTGPLKDLDGSEKSNVFVGELLCDLVPYAVTAVYNRVEK